MVTKKTPTLAREEGSAQLPLPDKVDPLRRPPHNDAGSSLMRGRCHRLSLGYQLVTSSSCLSGRFGRAFRAFVQWRAMLFRVEGGESARGRTPEGFSVPFLALYGVEDGKKTHQLPI